MVHFGLVSVARFQARLLGRSLLGRSPRSGRSACRGSVCSLKCFSSRLRIACLQRPLAGMSLETCIEGCSATRGCIKIARWTQDVRAARLVGRGPDGGVLLIFQGLRASASRLAPLASALRVQAVGGGGPVVNDLCSKSDKTTFQHPRQQGKGTRPHYCAFTFAILKISS